MSLNRFFKAAQEEFGVYAWKVMYQLLHLTLCLNMWNMPERETAAEKIFVWYSNIIHITEIYQKKIV